MPSPAVLTAELEADVVRELRRTWHDVNASVFRLALEPPSIELSDATGRLGHWDRTHRAIGLARSLVFGQPWGVVVEVLKHEMAHQYAHEVLGAIDEHAHGPAFRQVCARLGVDAAAAGFPSAAAAPRDRIVERIAHLLALAESSNEHEAQSAMNAAQKLMLRHNIERAAAHDRAGRHYAFRHLGKPTGRISEAERILAGVLSGHFFVEAIWVSVYRPLERKRGSVLEVCGATENLDLAAYVYDFLTHTAERLWAAHKSERRLRSNAPRRTFVAGVMRGFDEKLREAARAHKKEGLVWVGDAELGGYFRARHRYVRHVRYQSSRDTDDFARGREAGREIVLHRPVASGPSGGQRLLSAKSS